MISARKMLTVHIIYEGALQPVIINQKEVDFMELAEIMSLLNASGFVSHVHFYKYVMNEKTEPCANCFRFAGEIFVENDPQMPLVPRHPNCDCFFVEVDRDEYIRQKTLNSVK